MKKVSVFLGIMAVSTLLVSNQVFAKNPQAHVNKPWEAKADKNNDGVVQPKEYHHWNKAHSGPIDTPLEHKVDKNHDGHIEGAEKQYAKSKVNTPMENTLDTNNDGRVDRYESTHRP